MEGGGVRTPRISCFRREDWRNRGYHGDYSCSGRRYDRDGRYAAPPFFFSLQIALAAMHRLTTVCSSGIFMTGGTSAEARFLMPVCFCFYVPCVAAID